MNIAVVSDDKDFRLRLRKRLCDYYNNFASTIQIFSFDTGELFFESLVPGLLGIVFIDKAHDLTQADFFERLSERDIHCTPVMVCDLDEDILFFESIGALHFLPRTLDKKSVNEILERVTDNKLLANHYIEVVSNRQKKRIAMQEIIYATVQRNAVLIHTFGGTEKVYTRFGKLAPALLCDQRFLRAYHGCILNMDYVVDVEQNIFVMSNGERLTARKKGAASIRREYLQYIDTKQEMKQLVYNSDISINKG